MVKRLPNSVRKERAREALKQWRKQIGRERTTIAAARAKGIPIPPGTPQFLAKNNLIRKVSRDHSKWIYLSGQEWVITNKGIEYATGIRRNVVMK